MTTLLSAALAVLGVVATGVSVVAWWAAARSRRARIVLLALGFTAIACGGLVTAGLLWQDYGLERALTFQSLFVATGLVLVYGATVKQ